MRLWAVKMIEVFTPHPGESLNRRIPMPDGLTVDYDGLIPNNVGLNEDARVRKALETWHPGYIDWWKKMGPVGFQDALVYLRTAVGVGAEGWARFDYVKMPEYRWGILLAPRVEGRTIPFGAHKGEPVWQEVPGEHRAMLRRLLVIQGDTEPASVEQQRHLGATAPSQYDLRNLFQVNVEEGRHLWAMVYLLQKYFGRDGREEAEELLRRHSGDPDSPRMLGAFNERTPDWLSFFMFTFFTDRDGKMQLAALAQSGFDPLSRTCRFMLTEEAHHMFVGETGVQRIIQRTCEAMREAGIDDPYRHRTGARAGGDRPADHPAESQSAFLADAGSVRLGDQHQRGQCVQCGFEGPLSRGQAGRRPPIAGRHLSGAAAEGWCDRARGRAGAVVAEHAAARRFRRRYRGGDRSLEPGAGTCGHRIPYPTAACRVQPPDRRVRCGACGYRGTLLATDAWAARADSMLPTAEDYRFVSSLMKPVQERGAYAGWIAPPRTGIDNKPGDFEYVKIEADANRLKG